MDIRNFFGPPKKKAGAPAAAADGKKKRSAVDDDEATAPKVRSPVNKAKTASPVAKKVVAPAPRPPSSKSPVAAKAASPAKKEAVAAAMSPVATAVPTVSANPWDEDEAWSSDDDVMAIEDNALKVEAERISASAKKKPKPATTGLRSEMDASAFFAGAPIPAPTVPKKAAGTPRKTVLEEPKKLLPLDGALSRFFSKALLSGAEGLLEDMSRVAAEDYVKARGGKVGSAVSGKTQYLVMGTLLEDGRPATMGNKYRAATGRGVAVLEGKAALVTLVDRLVSGTEALPEAVIRARVNSAKKEEEKDRKAEKKKVVKAAITTVAVAARAKEEKPLWVDKHRPKSMRDVLGSAEVGKKLGHWLGQWPSMHLGPVEKRRKPPFAKENPGARAALISGPPGIGKSTMAALIAAEQGYEVYELNASDTRSKRSLSESLSDVVGSTVISGKVMRAGTRARRVIVMDEVDGLAGSADRGGSTELIKLIKTSSTPIICICNDRQSTKVKGLANSCYDLRMKRPMKSTIARRVIAIAKSEGLDIEDNAAELLAESCGNDIRQCINALQMWTMSAEKKQQEEQEEQEGVKPEQQKATYADMKDRLTSINKDAMQRFSAYDGARMILSDVKTKSHFERCDAYFIDMNIAPLLLQQNYVTAAMAGKTGDVLSKLDRIDASAACLSDVDVVSDRIRSQQYWALLPTEAALCVRVGVLAEGSCMNPAFPAWFGKNSTAGKCKRLAGDLAVHVSHRTSGARDSIRLEYMEPLRRHVSAPLLKGGDGSIEETIRRLDEYGLSRDDFLETLPEFALMDEVPGVCSLDTKTKTAFTRAYNGASHGSQALSQAVAPKKKAAAKRERDDDEGIDDEDDEPEEDEPEEIDDEAIAQLFAKKKRAPAKAKANKAPAAKKAKPTKKK